MCGGVRWERNSVCVWDQVGEGQGRGVGCLAKDREASRGNMEGREVEGGERCLGTGALGEGATLSQRRGYRALAGHCRCARVALVSRLGAGKP